MPGEAMEHFSSWNTAREGPDFEKYADGKIYPYIRGDDFFTKANSFAAAARKWGRDNGYKARVSVVTLDRVEISFTKLVTPTPGDVAAELNRRQGVGIPLTTNQEEFLKKYAPPQPTIPE